jgi:hypothetical protein
MASSPIPTYRTAADVLSRQTGSGARMLGWTVLRTLMIAPPMMIFGVPARQAWAGASLSSALISTFALLRIFDAKTVGLGGRRGRPCRRIRCSS